MFYEKEVFTEISQNSQENTVPESQACNFIKKKTLAQVFSCEFCEGSKKTFLQNTSEQLLLKRIRW